MTEAIVDELAQFLTPGRMLLIGINSVVALKHKLND